MEKAAPFTRIESVEAPSPVAGGALGGANEPIVVTIHADGPMPFAQVIVWLSGEQLAVVRAEPTSPEATSCRATLPRERLRPGRLTLQSEGCRVADIAVAAGSDWIKHFAEIEYVGEAGASAEANTGPGVHANFPLVTQRPADPSGVRIYFGIHKHMHQPYYRTADPGHWSGESDEIFGTRRGAYGDYLVDAVERYVAGGLPHAGLSASYSGSLIEQLDRCEAEGLAHGAYSHWKARLRGAAGLKTSLGHQRIDFVGFGFFHPLMPLIPERDIVRQVEWHREVIRNTFGVEASRLMFPPETAFHVRMIPALVKANIQCVIYDSIHRFRATKDYPYAGPPEGMLPPNLAEQENPAVGDWLQLNNIWAGSLVSPSLLRPSYLKYEDVEGNTHKIIGVPAERYIGNEDARGGFGALQYPSVLGQLYDQIVKTGSFDPKHPPFFLLHSDGDNYGGGTDSYYRHNTDGLVHWLQNDPRFELTTVLDYLDRFPVDEDNTCHVEPGSWSGADNGDPQFMKWFSNWDHAYSPDLNSWAVLTGLQNLIHSLEDGGDASGELGEARRLLLMAETSCYWYWTGQSVWDAQVTEAANLALSLLSSKANQACASDRTGPTIFPAWFSPINPGGKAWGHGCLVDAPRQGTLHTLIADIAGVRDATVIIRHTSGEACVKLQDLGDYPSQTSAGITARHFTCGMPTGLGNVRYYIEAKDQRGNVSRSTLERVYLH